MKDLGAQLEKLRMEAEDCALISRLATDANKRELYTHLARQLETLASGVESAIFEGAPEYDG